MTKVVDTSERTYTADRCWLIQVRQTRYAFRFRSHPCEQAAQSADRYSQTANPESAKFKTFKLHPSMRLARLRSPMWSWPARRFEQQAVKSRAAQADHSENLITP